MRFTSAIVAALPFVASVLGAPVAVKETTVAARDVDVISVVNVFVSSCTSALNGITSVSAAADISVGLDAVVKACGVAQVALGVNVNVGAAVNTKRDVSAEQVVGLVQPVLQEIETLIGSLPSEVATALNDVLVQLDPALAEVVQGLDLIVAGVANLLAGLLYTLGNVLSGLTGITSVLGGLL